MSNEIYSETPASKPKSSRFKKALAAVAVGAMLTGGAAAGFGSSSDESSFGWTGSADTSQSSGGWTGSAGTSSNFTGFGVSWQ